jgi:hypothetical protein
MQLIDQRVSWSLHLTITQALRSWMHLARKNSPLLWCTK